MAVMARRPGGPAGMAATANPFLEPGMTLR